MIPIVVEEPCATLADLAVASLIDEAELTPKPALVDRAGNGAHHDLDLARLCRSAIALHAGFTAMARAATGHRASAALREELARLGREAETCMLDVTGGSNAHRGAIWTLGLLVAAAAQYVSIHHGRKKSAAGLARAAAAIARFPDRFAPDRAETHGERACARYGVVGARGEAHAGFPHVIGIGLPTLRASRRNGASEDAARIDALLGIMAHLDDTCLLHRGGRTALATAKTGALAVLAAGGASVPVGRQLLRRLHTDLMAQWASPGGSGDLLAATLFVDRWEAGSSWRY